MKECCCNAPSPSSRTSGAGVDLIDLCKGQSDRSLVQELSDMNPNEEHLLWPNWADFSKRNQHCQFIAQGTLINKHSIGKTIGRARLHGPVIASEVRRVFNFALIDENYEEHGGRYKRSREDSHCATLNVEHTGNTRDKVNGILFSTSPADIDALARREYGYDLLPVEHQLGEEKSMAHMFIARKESQTIGHRVLDNILPNESSLSICLTGAATYGKVFLDAWIESCYLADGTPLMKNPYYENFVREALKIINV